MKPSQAKSTAIRRKAQVSEEDRTHAKTEAAQYIEGEILERGRWPMDLTKIAEETEWSRQHIANTIRDYFEPADDSTGDEQVQTEEKPKSSSDLDIDVMKLIEVYRMGYQDGRRDAEQEGDGVESGGMSMSDISGFVSSE
jgi:predicted patatin/cPLA2 family phospholipase